MNIVKALIKKLSMSNHSLFNPSADRNKEPILQVLKKIIPQYIAERTTDDPNRSFRCLEISSGTGQHVVHFAQDFASVTFQPSEYDRTMFKSIFSYIENTQAKNVNPPIYIDARDDFRSWESRDFVKESSLDFVININMMHISPFSCAQGLFKNSAQILCKDGLLFTYGPYGFQGKIFPESNERFNASLQSQDPQWGIRDVESMLVPLAASVGLRLVQTIAMPANNHVLIWKKE